MRILVLGGTGFIGPDVVRQLASRGHAVTVAHTGAHEADLPATVTHLHHPGFARADRRDFPTARELIDEARPDVVVDMFPMTEADARVAVETLKGMASRLVAISSQDVYRAYGILHGREPGPPDPVPLAEDAPLRRQLFPYRQDPPRASDAPDRWMDDYEKILVERAVLGEPSLPGTTLRLPAVLGPGDGHRILPYLKRMDDRRPAILLGERQARWRWTRGFVQDVARAIALAVVDGRAAGKVYNVALPEAPTEEEWVRRIAGAAGWEGEIVVVPDDHLPRHLRSAFNFNQDAVADSRRIREELGYAEEVPFADALRRTIEWERTSPPDTIDRNPFDYEAEDGVLRQASAES